MEQQFLELMEALHEVYYYPFRRDRLVWTPTTNGALSVAALYEILCHDCLFNVNCKATTFWKCKAMHRVKAFMWLLGLRRPLVIDQLCKRGMIIRSMCLLCKRDEEVIDHFFLQCPLMKFGTRSLKQRVSPGPLIPL
ncbi:hypothetical protein AMTR_s00120p00040260 [Amborella trichopoda]|uniref:Reverse transcriptase zinc-binding domain-containing protein n=1 Tax=Amborella trichopoda TaxID=13333 RepID=W1NSZ3_AMBTC|nr:hypothetical protein AMTR_s00120p00040260 [Amborella trichopoda]